MTHQTPKFTALCCTRGGMLRTGLGARIVLLAPWHDRVTHWTIIVQFADDLHPQPSA